MILLKFKIYENILINEYYLINSKCESSFLILFKFLAYLKYDSPL
jgi:hypothetical protein